MNDVYLDSLHNSAEDLGDIKRADAAKLSPRDKRQIVVLALLDAAVIVFIGLYLMLTGSADIYKEIKKNAAFDPAVDYYNVADAFAALTPTLNAVSFPEGMQQSFRALYSENADTVGWLKIAGTGIDGVVLQAEDNAFYERRDFYKRDDKRTRVFFADFRNYIGENAASLSKVTILYGHHLTADERIWAELENYKDPEYYKTHPVIEFNTIYGNYKWKVFACMITSSSAEKDGGNLFYYWNPYVTDEQTVAFCTEVLNRSWFVNPAVNIAATDKLLCLSTCNYEISMEDIRCVVFARLVRDGESAEVDVSGTYFNEDRRMPQLWYDQPGLANPYINTPVFGQ